jgi:hypothetical protein
MGKLEVTSEQSKEQYQKRALACFERLVDDDLIRVERYQFSLLKNSPNSALQLRQFSG